VTCLNTAKDSVIYIQKGDLQGMPAVEVGRICVKMAGRETGKKCVVVDLLDKSFVMVTGPQKLTGVKRKRANINHLLALQDRVDVKRGASDEEVTSTIQAAGKLEEMKQPA
jgi:large subunit ribosomal protein L14e